MATIICGFCKEIFEAVGNHKYCKKTECKKMGRSIIDKKKEESKKSRGLINRTICISSETWALAKKIGGGVGVTGIKKSLSEWDDKK